MAKVMNGIRGNTNEVKYPVNCAARIMQPALAGAGSLSEAELDELYEPKPDKKVVRVVTVIAYMFSVSLGKPIFLHYYQMQYCEIEFRMKRCSYDCGAA